MNKTLNEQKNSLDEHGAFLVTKIEDGIMNADTLNIWLLDSGASKHMSFQRNWFHDFMEINELVYLGDGSTCDVKGRGTIYIQKYVNGSTVALTMYYICIVCIVYVLYVLYVASLKKNLFSTGVVTQKGFDLRLTSDNVFIYSRNNLVVYGKREKNNLYRMVFKIVTKHEANIVEKNDLSLWHQRLAHINSNRALRGIIDKMNDKNLVNRIELNNSNAFFCECCVLGN